MSFMFPALIIACIGFTVFMFLVPKPSHVGLTLETKVPISFIDFSRKLRLLYFSDFGAHKMLLVIAKSRILFLNTIELLSYFRFKV